MATILNEIVATKRAEIREMQRVVPLDRVAAASEQAGPPRDFIAAIRSARRPALIAEVKRASPSGGVLRANFNPAEIARAYQEAGAACISVLTDRVYFHGSLEHLVEVRQAVDVPVLRKEFVLDPYQVFQARAAGADAVLLIAECLDDEMLRQLHDLILQLGMAALVELHQAEHLPRVLEISPQLVGINNRDLRNFKTNLNHTLTLRRQIPDGICVVSESGISRPEDVQRLAAADVDAMLVGEALITCPDIRGAVRQLLAAPPVTL